MRHYRSAILLICFAGISCPFLRSQQSTLTAEPRGDRLHVTAPQMHFLVAKPLGQLQNGASVTYAFALAIAGSPGNKTYFSQQESFVVSFDLWEERFSVVQTGSHQRSVSHLTAAEAEAWCIDAVSAPLSALPSEKTFVIKLACQVVRNGTDSESRSLTLAGLIDVFSRKEREAPMHWEAASEVLHRADLKVKSQGQARRLAEMALILLNQEISGIPGSLWQFLLGR